MPNTLHPKIAAIAKKDPAIHVSEFVLVNLITNRLDRALKSFKGFYQPYPAKTPRVQIGLKTCDYNRTTAKWAVDFAPSGTQPGTFEVFRRPRLGFESPVTKLKERTLSFSLRH